MIIDDLTPPNQWVVNADAQTHGRYLAVGARLELIAAQLRWAPDGAMRDII